jgi:hypothetical protein
MENPTSGCQYITRRTFKKTVTILREADGRAANTPFCIVDATSAKNTDTAEEKGYDGSKPSRYILPKLYQTSFVSRL